MRALSSVAVVAATVALGGALYAPAVRACDRLPIPAAAFVAFPADGTTDVVLDVRPIVPAADVFSGPRTGLHLEQGPDFDVVDADADVIAVTGEYGGRQDVARLTPRAPLQPNTLYRLADDTGRLAEFTTGTGESAAPLEAPVVALGSPTLPQDDTTGFGCAFDGAISLTVTPALANVDQPVLAFALVTAGDDSDDDALATVPDTVDGLGSPGLLVFGDEVLTVQVRVMDGAGRTSPATTVTVDLLPAPLWSCQAAPGLSPLALALLGLGFRRRRRRR